MIIKDLALAFLVAFIWGINFIVIKLGLEGMPPFLLAALRFSAVAIPAVFFIPPPKVPLAWMIMYGMTMSFGQFALLFCAINIGMPAGVASLVIQFQVFFTVFISVVFLHEKLILRQAVGILIAVAGMGVLLRSSAASDTSLSVTGFLLTIGAAISWAFGNISSKVIMRRNPGVKIMPLVIWSALIPVIPFFVCSWLFEGVPVIQDSLVNIRWGTVLAILYLAIFATLIGYAIWGRLLARYESWRLVPFALLVPIIGLIGASIILHEELSIIQILGVGITLLGLIVNIFGLDAFKRLNASGIK